MYEPSKRKGNKDQEGTVYMDATLVQLVQKAMFDYDLKFSDLARRALSHYIKNVLPLSQQKPMNPMGNWQANGSNNGLPQAGNSPANNTFTLDQVAQLMILMQKVQK